MNKSTAKILIIVGGSIITLLLLSLLGAYFLFSKYFNHKNQTYEKRFELAQPFINDARQKMGQENFQDAVDSWDHALELVPEYADGHYQRGHSYLKLLEYERSLENYNTLLDAAHKDMDLAIELDPANNGNYYFDRFVIYDDLASGQADRVNYASYEEVALDNLLASYKLGTTENLANRYVLFVYYYLGRCDEMLEETQKQMAVQTEPSATLNLSMGLYYYCKGDLETALQFATEAVRVGKEKQLGSGYCERSFYRAEILLKLGRYPEALTEINDSIGISPYYCGYRYYLRSLIYANMGDIENAEKDAEFGMSQTWGRGGLLSYAQAKIALAKGDSEKAIVLLQEAESSYHFQDPILMMIQEELQDLGGTRLEMDPPLTIVTPFVIQNP